MNKTGQLVIGSVYKTKISAGYFATGYRGIGMADKPRGSVKVEPVGKYWGVFDYNNQPGKRYMSIAEGIKQGKRIWGQFVGLN